MQLLMIEDEDILRISLQDELKERGYEVHSFDDPLPALKFFSQSPLPIVVSDIRLPHMDGLEVLSRIKTIQPDTAVILMTAFGEISTAVEAIKKGAFDYLTKPFDMEELIIRLERACNLKELREENVRLRETLAGNNLIGESESVQLLRNSIETASNSNLTVLLTGETGTGKDLTAELIHVASPRSRRPLVKIACAQYSSTVLESELFGHEQGAFTGATRKKKGKFSLAPQGTVYLDDVDDISLEIQVKLLRVLDEKIVEPVGSLQQIPVDIRIICSTKKDLTELIQQGRFRDDLYYRLNAYPINLPPLREHKEDIPLLVRYSWDRMGHPEMSLTEDALKAMGSFNWPGNVRELKNIAARLAVSCPSNLVSKEDLPAELREEHLVRPTAKPETFMEIMASMERKILAEALSRASGNQSKAARNLGMKLSTFRDRIARHTISTDPADKKMNETGNHKKDS
jgi:DNA-binding NtrC family response regulator